jgi:hypothetical protein
LPRPLDAFSAILRYAAGWDWLAGRTTATEHFSAVAQSRALEDTLLAVSHSPAE